MSQSTYYPVTDFQVKRQFLLLYIFLSLPIVLLGLANLFDKIRRPFKKN